MTLTPTDSDLLLRLHHGEESAFALIYQRYASMLLNFTAARIPREDAEEIVQEVFVSLWARREKLQTEIDLRPYLFASVKYMIIRYVSRLKVKQKYLEHYRLFETVYQTVPEAHDDEAVREMMEKGLASLPERCQQAVRLRLIENLSNSEIAKRMNVHKSTVENYMVTGVKELRRSFKRMEVLE